MGSLLIEEIGALHETIEHLKNATTRLLARAEDAEEENRRLNKVLAAWKEEYPLCSEFAGCDKCDELRKLEGK